MIPLQPALKIAFDDLVDTAHEPAFDERFPMSGSFHKLARGAKLYWYHIMRDPAAGSGRRSTYAGAVGDPDIDALVERHGRQKSRHKARKGAAALLRRAGLPALEKTLRVSIVGRDASGPGGDVIRGARIPIEANAVKVPAFLPGGSWLISAVPREGWHEAGPWRMPQFLVRLGLSLLASLAIARILHDRRRIKHLAGVDALTQLPNRRLALRQLPPPRVRF